MRRIHTLTSFLFALALGLIGCGGDSKVTIKLTDAPGDFKRAVVTISEVELLGEGANNRVVLLNEAKTTDLLTLANDTADLVKDATVPSGTYKELRFVITGAFIEVEEADGSTKIYASSTDYEGLPEGATVAGSLQMLFQQRGHQAVLPQATIIGRQMHLGPRAAKILDPSSQVSTAHPIIQRHALYLSAR